MINAGYVIAVRDQGAGVPGEIQPCIFERVVRGDPARQRGPASDDGAGLWNHVTVHTSDSILLTDVPVDGQAELRLSRLDDQTRALLHALGLTDGSLARVETSLAFWPVMRRTI